MADITITARTTILEKVSALVDELLAINNRAAEMETSLEGLGDDDAEDTIELLLAAAGLATGTDHDGVGEDTISDQIVGILYGNITVTVNGVATALSWTHAAS